MWRIGSGDPGHKNQCNGRDRANQVADLKQRVNFHNRNKSEEKQEPYKQDPADNEKKQMNSILRTVTFWTHKLLSVSN
jgi:hypothetical protein